MTTDANDLRAAGYQVREQLIGLRQQAFAPSGDPIVEEFRELLTVTVFGALWSRPGLDLKTRILICVITDAAAGLQDELFFHTQTALNQGWEKAEIVEALFHMSGYVGVPLIRGAIRTASRAFAAWDAAAPAE